MGGFYPRKQIYGARRQRTAAGKNKYSKPGAEGSEIQGQQQQDIVTGGQAVVRLQGSPQRGMQAQRSSQGPRQAGSEHRGQHRGSAGAQPGKSGRQRSLGAGPKTSVPLCLSRPSSCFIRGLLLGLMLLPTSACDRPVVPQLHVTALLFEPLRRRELDVLSVTSMTH